MVAALQPRVPQSGFPQGSPAAARPRFGVSQAQTQNTAQRAPAPKSTYDLTKAVSDFGAWRANLLNYYTTTLIPIDNFYEERQPGTPFYTITGQTVPQYVSPLIRNGYDGVSAFIRPQAIRLRCPAEDNPGATEEERTDTEGALKFVFDFHIRRRIANMWEQIKREVGLRGAAIVQVSWLTPDDAKKLNKQFPIRIDVHDIFDCAWNVGDDDQLLQVLILKKKSAAQVPANLLAAAGVTNMNSEVDALEYWDETSSGMLINGKIVKPLTPHGYTNEAGDPACPVVYIPHDARRQRIGGVAPLASGVSQRGVLMGTPIVESLLNRCFDDSRVKTRLMYYTDIGMRGLLKLKGIAIRDGKAVIDFDAGVLELEDTPQSEAEWLQPPNVTPALGMLMDVINKDAAAAFASQGIQSGELQQDVSGTSANHQTSWQRARADSFAISLEDGYTKLAYILMGMMRANLIDSARTLHKTATGTELRLLPGPTDQPSAWDAAVVLPLYKGAGYRDIGPSTFRNIVKIVVEVEPDTRTPQEVEVQQALALGSAKSPIASMQWIRAHKMHMDNPEEEENQILREQMEADPTTVWGQIRRQEATVYEYLKAVADPNQRDRILQMLAQWRDQQIIAALSQPPAPPQPAGPGGPPPMGAPPGGPPPPMAGPQPLPPQFSPPAGMPPPGALPPGAGGMGPPMQPSALLPTPPMQPTPFGPPPGLNPMQGVA